MPEALLVQAVGPQFFFSVLILYITGKYTLPRKKYIQEITLERNYYLPYLKNKLITFHTIKSRIQTNRSLKTILNISYEFSHFVISALSSFLKIFPELRISPEKPNVCISLI